ncbi:hypothetical protein [Paenibacillus sp. FSL R7-0273]|uniref:glycosyltransferase family 2 protein n=1 Tax=Paenibacillus sp. FSL R7-0273 TaxID=1536772 RepID=UPI0005879D27|nr:hypothetical protein [Paenibacillus sp. FSL R7-0273]OMF84395.1 hypothetical protein BK144_30115 [Paenibacillus sp. FSL R7-0273]
MPYDAEARADAVSPERLAGRYSYLEREGLLPLPAKDGVTIVVELAHKEWAEECLNRLMQHSGPAVRLTGVVMEEDFPLQPLLELFSAEQELSFLPYERGNYRINEALAEARTSFVVLVEDRVMVTEGWLGELLWPSVDDPATFAAAPCSAAEEREGRAVLRFGDDLELSAYVNHQLSRRRGEWLEAEVLSGPCLVISREILQRTGGLDSSLLERRYILADWCLRARQQGAKLALCAASYVHVLQQLTGTAGLPESEAQAAYAKARRAYCAKWQLPDEDLRGTGLPVPGDLSALERQPAIPLGKAATALPLVTAVVYFEEKWPAEASMQRQLLLMGQQSYSNIRWVSVRDSWNDTSPDSPVHERDTVITVQGEKAWLHALESFSAMYQSEVTVYLSASASYDSEYVTRIVMALQHSSAALIVSAAPGLAESELPDNPERGAAVVLPLERTAHRGGIMPGRLVKRESSRRSLLLCPGPELAVGYIAGAAASGAAGCNNGEGGTGL